MNKNLTESLIFTEFLEYLQEYYSPNRADEIVSASRFQPYGAYTSVDTNHHKALVTQISALSRGRGLGATDLICASGKHLFARLIKRIPPLIQPSRSRFVLLWSMHEKIHLEVREHYSVAELPTFEYHSRNLNQLFFFLSFEVAVQ